MFRTLVHWQKSGEVVNKCTIHNNIILAIFYAKNYQSWWKFDKVMPKTILTVFLRCNVEVVVFTLHYNSGDSYLFHIRQWKQIWHSTNVHYTSTSTYTFNTHTQKLTSERFDLITKQMQYIYIFSAGSNALTRKSIFSDTFSLTDKGLNTTLLENH